jgi:hypothetical protein
VSIKIKKTCLSCIVSTVVNLYVCVASVQIVTIKQEIGQGDSSHDVENGLVPLVSDCSAARDDVSVSKTK